jgi:uncharacterized protein (TIGR00730 family)
MSARSLCVYCGSRPGARPAYVAAARRLGALMAARGIQLVYGGGRVGLMGILADSVLEAGGEAIGILPDFLRAVERPHGGLHALKIVGSMHERKQMMFEMSDAFAALPGGLGTLDETFEIMTWRQLAQHEKPIVLVNIESYWDPLLALIDQVETEGFAHGPRDLFSVVEDVEALMALLERTPAAKVAESAERL